MEYKHLLLSAGGGILGDTHKAQQDPHATIAIGLGGTGIDCLRNLKRQVYDRLQPDAPSAIEPEYSHIRFLAVDSDRCTVDPDGKINDLDIDTEFFDISCPDLPRLLARDRVLAAQPECSWLKHKDANGQGGLPILSNPKEEIFIPQVRRLLIVKKSDAFVGKVRQLILEARAGLPGCSELDIHIFSGLGGSTGSGIFLDVCYLVQKALMDLGEYGHARICGYFFLPDVALSDPCMAANAPVSRSIEQYGFAAMKELDYCMNFKNNGGEWDQDYGSFTCKTKDAPVNLCHLISAHNMDGDVVGRQYAMDMVADYVMRFLSRSNDLSPAALLGPPMARQIRSKHGANCCYYVLGGASAVLPRREINTYLASKLFKKMAPSLENIPSDAEIAAFVAASGLSYQALFWELLKGTAYQAPVPALDHKMFTGMSEDDLALPDEFHLPETIMNPFRHRQTQMLGKITENKFALLGPLFPTDPDVERDCVSRMGRVYAALADVVQDPQKGPVYAAAILKGSGSRNLVEILKGIQRETQDAMNHIKCDMELRIKAIKDTRHAFLHPGFFGNRRRLFETFIQSVSQYFTSSNQLLVLEQMESMLRDMIDQMDWMYERYFKIYTQVTRNLMETFHRNYQDLTGGHILNARPFVMPLVTIADLQPSLDEAVDSMDLDSETSYFHKALFSNNEVWLHNEEKKIAKFVSDYLLSRFSGYSNKSLTSYLEIRFNTTWSLLLANQVYNQIMIPLYRKAAPLYWHSSSHDISDAVPLYYCSVPNTAPAVNSAAITLEFHHPDLRPFHSNTPDRISVHRCFYGVPLYGYAGTEPYYKAYKNSAEVGIHLYEGTERDDRDWRLLPNLIPYSLISNPDQRLQEASDLYDEAERLQIIRPSRDCCDAFEIAVYPAIGELQQAVDAADGDPQAAGAAVKAFLANWQPVDFISIPNDGAPGFEARVRKDHVLASNFMLGILRQEVDRRHTLDAMAAAQPE